RDGHVTGVQTCALPISKNVPLGMKEKGCPLTAAIAISVATARKTALTITSLERRLSVDPFEKSRDIKWVKLDCRTGKVCIEHPRSEERRVGKEMRNRRW